MSIIVKKSFELALEIVAISKKLRASKEFDFASQLFRAGTSIGANVHEARGGQSNKDFIAKIHIALKESFETRYWIYLLKKSKTLEDNQLATAENLLQELIAMIIATIKTSKAKT